MNIKTYPTPPSPLPAIEFIVILRYIIIDICFINRCFTVLKGVDTSPVVTAKVSAQGITLARQLLNERSSAYLCYDRVTSVIEGHRSFSVCV